jgi:hypothetical protein
MKFLREAGLWKRLPLVWLALAASPHCLGATYTTPRVLNVGDIYELRRDGWSDPAGGPAYNGDVLPKTDTNAGIGGDILYFRRHNVARAWPTDVGYWYTASDQNEGEPDPAGEQWVDYAPPIEVLAPGRYSIAAAYRWSTNRASYPAVYTIHHALGTNVVLRDQRLGSPTLTIVYITLGEFEMRPGSFVRVEDTGSESISFSNMRFRLLSPVPRLDAAVSGGACQLHWPTNATGYRLECAGDLTESGVWQPVTGEPIQSGTNFTVTLSVSDTPKYFRLANP